MPPTAACSLSLRQAQSNPLFQPPTFPVRLTNTNQTDDRGSIQEHTGPDPELQQDGARKGLDSSKERHELHIAGAWAKYIRIKPRRNRHPLFGLGAAVLPLSYWQRASSRKRKRQSSPEESGVPDGEEDLENPSEVRPSRLRTSVEVSRSPFLLSPRPWCTAKRKLGCQPETSQSEERPISQEQASNHDNEAVNNEQWHALVALHRTLLDEHRDYYCRGFGARVPLPFQSARDSIMTLFDPIMVPDSQSWGAVSHPPSIAHESECPRPLPEGPALRGQPWADPESERFFSDDCLSEECTPDSYDGLCVDRASRILNLG